MAAATRGSRCAARSRRRPTTITRTDGVSWASAGFAVGQPLTVNGTLAGTITALNGATLTISGGTFAGRPGGRRRRVRDPKTRATRIGGDTIIDHRRRRPGLAARGLRRHLAGRPLVRRRPDAPVRRLLRQQAVPVRDRQRRAQFVFPLASPYVYAGNDTIDACALFRAARPARCRTWASSPTAAPATT